MNKKVTAVIVSDFTGSIGIWSKQYYLRNAIFATIPNGVNPSSGTINNNRNNLLFGLQDSSNMKWEYHFENATVITAPTATTTGSFQQTAVGAPTVTRDITLNPLNADDYVITYQAFDTVSPKITYTLKDLSYGDVSINYDLPAENDPGYTWSILSAPTTDFEGELSATHSNYPGLEITGYVLPIINPLDYSVEYVAPTVSNVIGKIQFTYPTIASNPVFYEQLLLSANTISFDYDSATFFTENGSQYTVLPIPNTPTVETVWSTGTGSTQNFALNEETDYAVYVKSMVNGVLTEAYLAYSFTTPNQVAYLLAAAKESAQQTLDDYLAALVDPSATVTGIIASAKTEIDAAETSVGFDERILKAFSDVENQILLEEKNIAKQELDTYLSTLSDPSATVLGIITASKAEIDVATTSVGFDDQILETITAVKNQILLEEKNQAKQELDTYLFTLTNPSENVTEIITSAKAAIDAAESSTGFAGMILQAISDVEDQILLEEKNLAKQELDTYLSTLTNPSATVTGIITTAKNEIDDAVTSVGFETFVLEAIKDSNAQVLVETKNDATVQLQNKLAEITNPSSEVNNLVSTATSEIAIAITPAAVLDILTQAISDIEASILLAEKTDAKQDLDDILSSITNPSIAVSRIISAAKADVDAAQSSDGFETLILKAQTDVNHQILLEEKNLAKQELDTYLSTITDPSTTVSGIIAVAKSDIDSAGTSAGFADLILQTITDVEAQLLEESKSSSIDFIAELVASLLPQEITPSSELQTLIDELNAGIDNAQSITEVENLMNQAQPGIEMQATNDALTYEFSDIFNTYSNDHAYQYSDAGLTQLETIFDTAALLLQNPSLTVAEKNAVLNQAIMGFVQVPIIALGEIRPNDPSIDETMLDPNSFYVSVDNNEGMQKGMHVLVIRKEPIVGSADIYGLIDQGNIDTSFSSLTKQIARTILGKQVIFCELEVQLLDSNNQTVVDFSTEDRYHISMYLPEELRLRENIHVVFLMEGKIELFDVTREGDWISFTTNHFGEFYLIGDPILGDEANGIDYINLWWLIILLGIVILLELLVIFWKTDQNNHTKRLQSVLLPLTILIPINAYTILWIEIVLIVVLFGIIVFVFADCIFPKRKSIIEDDTLQKNDPLYAIASSSISQSNAFLEPLNLSQSNEIETKKVGFTRLCGESWSYSLTARMHQAPAESMMRYNQIKNQILSYPGTKSRTSWTYERFIHDGKTIVKLTLSGQTIRIYFNLDKTDLEQNICQLKFQSIKEHETTPYMMLIKGNRNLHHALQIINLILQKTGNSPKSILEIDYRLPYLSKSELIEKGLVKINKDRNGL